jgi:zinc/manganese transport system substrate-binding protein
VIQTSDQRSVIRRWAQRNMPRLLAWLAVALGAARAAPARADLKVVATVPGLAAIAKEIAGPAAEVKSLTRASQDPHFVDARPSLALDLNRADLLLTVGLELEVGWLPTLLTGARNREIMTGGRGYLDCSQFVHLQDVQTRLVDRSMGDIHPSGNPHYLADPRAAALVARGIATRLAALDPPHQAAYQKGLGAFLARLDAARAGWEKRLAPFRGTPVVAYHKTWAYVAEWIGVNVVGFLEPKPGIPPNPSHVVQLLAVARQAKVKAVLQEEYYPDTTSRLVSERIPAALVKVPGGPDYQSGQSYADYVERLVTLLEQGLKGPRSGS